MYVTVVMGAVVYVVEVELLAAAGVEVVPLRGMILYTKKSRSCAVCVAGGGQGKQRGKQRASSGQVSTSSGQVSGDARMSAEGPYRLKI